MIDVRALEDEDELGELPPLDGVDGFDDEEEGALASERITDEILSGPLADVADGEDALGDCANSSSPFVFFDGGDDGPGLDLRDTSEATNLALGDEGLVSFGADEDEIVAGEDSAPALAFSLDEGICDSSPTQVGKDGGEDGPLTADDPIGEANLPPLDAGDADEEADVAAN